MVYWKPHWKSAQFRPQGLAFLIGENVDSEGLEPPTYWFEANRSIQLSYESKFSRCEGSACGEVAVGRARMRKYGEKGALTHLTENRSAERREQSRGAGGGRRRRPVRRWANWRTATRERHRFRSGGGARIRRRRGDLGPACGGAQARRWLYFSLRRRRTQSSTGAFHGSLRLGCF